MFWKNISGLFNKALIFFPEISIILPLPLKPTFARAEASLTSVLQVQTLKVQVYRAQREHKNDPLQVSYT